MLPFFKPKKGFQFAGSGLDAGSGGGGGGGGSIDTSALANKTDLTAIILTGTTNTSGNVISPGTWFYLNGKPCIAKVDIASGATFTLNTNYEEKTIGSALTELNSKIGDLEQVPQPNVGIENVSTLAQLFGLFTSWNQIAAAGVGDAHNNAFQQLVGNPGQIGNYGQAIVRPVDLINKGLGYDTLEITAYPQFANNTGYSTVIKRKYVYHDSHGNYSQSEWKTIADNFS